MTESREIFPVPGPVSGTIRPPGSKSITNRALVIAALADGASTLTGVLESRDTQVMRDSLRRLGIPLDENLHQHRIVVQGQRGKIRGNALEVFFWMFVVGFGCRAISALCLSLQSEPPHPTIAEPYLQLGSAFRQFMKRSSGRLLLLAVSMQAGVYLSAPFFTPFMLKQLHLSYLQYAVLIAISFIAKSICLPWWGRYVSRRGAHALLRIGAIGIVPMAAVWSLTDNYWFLAAQQIVAGALWAAYELGLMILFFEAIPTRERTATLTVYNFANSGALVVGSLIGAACLQLFGEVQSTYHGLFIASSCGRFAALWFLPRLPVAEQAQPVTAAETADVAA